MSRFPNFTLRILGIRGLPATDDGDEQFAQDLSLYLIARGWRVVVYCQGEGAEEVSENTWNGVERIVLPMAGGLGGAEATKLFHRHSFQHAAQFQDLCLTLGNGTPAVCAWLRLNGVPNVIRMDADEWRRTRWSDDSKVRIRNLSACWMGNHLIAEHPQIVKRLATRVSRQKISTIGAGAKQLVHADPAPLAALGLAPQGYVTVVSHAEPRNALKRIVRAFSTRRRGIRLVVLGDRDDKSAALWAQLSAAASDEVLFLDKNHDREVLDALRFHALAYVHGHQVGRGNAALVDALAAGNAVIAHDNRYNRWAAGDGARYFRSAGDLSAVFDDVLDRPDLLAGMRAASVTRFEAGFELGRVLSDYENLLERWLPTPCEDTTPRMRKLLHLGEGGLKVELSDVLGIPRGQMRGKDSR